MHGLQREAARHHGADRRWLLLVGRYQGAAIVLQHDRGTRMVFGLGKQVAIVERAGAVLAHFQVHGGLVTCALYVELHTHKAVPVALVHGVGDVRTPAAFRLLAEALQRGTAGVLYARILCMMIGYVIIWRDKNVIIILELL